MSMKAKSRTTPRAPKSSNGSTELAAVLVTLIASYPQAK